jgi:uncharacterized membrane protein YebE (DUF533 family)
MRCVEAAAVGIPTVLGGNPNTAQAQTLLRTMLDAASADGILTRRKQSRRQGQSDFVI